MGTNTETRGHPPDSCRRTVPAAYPRPSSRIIYFYATVLVALQGAGRAGAHTRRAVIREREAGAVVDVEEGLEDQADAGDVARGEDEPQKR